MNIDQLKQAIDEAKQQAKLIYSADQRQQADEVIRVLEEQY